MSAVALSAVAKRFGATDVLTDIELSVPDGSLTAILGASGSGKTTLLRIIAGFEHVDHGTVWIGKTVVDNAEQRFVAPQHRGVGYVPQDGALFPHLTVAGNVGFGLARTKRGEVGDLIELVGLGGLAKRYPHQLSGGQQQRVALARALAIHPQVVLLDEPFSSLDASLRVGLRRDVVRILAETGTTTVLVTHDQDEALSLADQIAVLDHGRMIAVADPRQLYRQPPDVATATSIGEANLVRAVISGGVATSALGPLTLEAGGPSDGPGLALLRPEQIHVHADERSGAPSAEVTDVQFHGHDALAALTLDSADREAVLARVPGDQELAVGQRVWLEVSGRARAWSAS